MAIIRQHPLVRAPTRGDVIEQEVEDGDGGVTEKTTEDEERRTGAPGSSAVQSSSAEDRAPDIYDRFSPRHKRAMTAIMSYNAFIAPMTAAIFLPSIPAIARDLNSTPTVINITVAVFIITIGTAPLIWSPLSGFYGRRAVYLASVPVMLISTIGVANSHTVAQLTVTRVLQGIGSSSSLAVGAGCIGDVYRPTERSNAMSWFYTGALLGPSLSPLLGAAFTEYTALGWRAAQYFIAGCAALAITLTFFFLPETLHPPVPHHVLQEERGKRFVMFVFNPLHILGLFGYPNICAITYISSAVMLLLYAILVPLSTLLSTQYGIHNSIISGCLFLCNGGGNIIGSRIAGPMADATVKRYIAKRGFRRPEDRLRAAVFGCGVVMPACCVAYGWLVQTSAGGIGPPIVFMILQAIGLMLVLTPVNTYAVDCMASGKSANVIAVNNWVRYLFAAAASAFVLPMSEAIGWGWTITVSAVLVWIAFGILLLTIRYGHLWREAANKRFGYTVQAEDEKHVDTGQGSIEAPRPSEEHHDEHADAHTDLPAAGTAGKVPPRTGDVGRAGSTLDRQRSRGEMPRVDDVLKRTVSLTGASVHGGG